LMIGRRGMTMSYIRMLLVFVNILLKICLDPTLSLRDQALDLVNV
jgi:hypothetical protein